MIAVAFIYLLWFAYILGHRRGRAYYRLRRPDLGCHPVVDYEGTHRWGLWSAPYDAWVNGPAGPHERWQQRQCQCGNRDWRRAPERG